MGGIGKIEMIPQPLHLAQLKNRTQAPLLFLGAGRLDEANAEYNQGW